MERRYGVGLCKYIYIYVLLKIMLEKRKKSEYDIIQILFKCCESKMYLILLIPNYKCTYNQIDLIKNKLELFITNWSYSYNK